MCEFPRECKSCGRTREGVKLSTVMVGSEHMTYGGLHFLTCSLCLEALAEAVNDFVKNWRNEQT